LLFPAVIATDGPYFFAAISCISRLIHDYFNVYVASDFFAAPEHGKTE
jgi:hypothetical protein